MPERIVSMHAAHRSGEEVIDGFPSRPNLAGGGPAIVLIHGLPGSQSPEQQVAEKGVSLTAMIRNSGRIMMANKWDERKKAKEDEYFVKRERELLAKLKLKQEAEAKEAAGKASLMKCPKCGAPLKERSFQKIQIDQCTGCNGIWLDAGELEQVAAKENTSWLGKFWQKNG